MSSTAALQHSFVVATGRFAVEALLAIGGALSFLGRTTLAIPRTLSSTKSLRRREFMEAVQEAGIETLPLVAFVAFAMGSVLALVGVPQLDRLGAALVAPNLVAIVILREMGALMTGFCMAGRLGSANAAELATHASMAHPPGTRADVDEAFDELVVPRVVAMALMGPLLVLYANAFGLLGSITVGAGLLDIPAVDYVDRTRAAFTAKATLAGLIRGGVFGVAVGLAGCFHGLRSGGGPVAVSQAVRRGVVTAVLGVVVTDVILAIFFNKVRF